MVVVVVVLLLRVETNSKKKKKKKKKKKTQHPHKRGGFYSRVISNWKPRFTGRETTALQKIEKGYKFRLELRTIRWRRRRRRRRRRKPISLDERESARARGREREKRDTIGTFWRLGLGNYRDQRSGKREKEDEDFFFFLFFLFHISLILIKFHFSFLIILVFNFKTQIIFFIFFHSPEGTCLVRQIRTRGGERKWDTWWVMSGEMQGVFGWVVRYWRYSFLIYYSIEYFIYLLVFPFLIVL